MGNEYEISPDDALEQTRSIRVTDLNDQEELEEDNDTPAAPADDEVDAGSAHIPIDHPILDTDIDPTEIYHDGIDTVADLPHNGYNRGAA